MFSNVLKVNQSAASLLVEYGYASIEDVAYVPVEELFKTGLDKSTIDMLQDRARKLIFYRATGQHDEE